MNIFESTRTLSIEAKKTVIEDMTFDTENLADTDIPTSAENDMSLIMLLNVAGSKILFTGDAGTQGLFKSIMYCIEQNISLLDLDLFDVPHHGSRKNLSKGILKYIRAKYSVISCAVQGEPKHPSPVVTNSLIRRNMNPYVTQGRMLNYRSNGTPARKNINAIQPVQFKSEFEI
jgi:beta-lactamase superfamily II metal-dependent hydrolase